MPCAPSPTATSQSVVGTDDGSSAVAELTIRSRRDRLRVDAVPAHDLDQLRVIDDRWIILYQEPVSAPFERDVMHALLGQELGTHERPVEPTKILAENSVYRLQCRATDR